MLSEWEELRSLERQAQTMRKGYEPWKAAAVEERAEELRERLVYFEDLHQVIVDLASDRVQAGVIWVEITRSQDDSMQRCSQLASTLYARDLLTPEQFQEVMKKVRFIPNVTRKARQATEDEEKALNGAVEMVLKTVEPARRDDARYEYNKLEGFRTWEKLNDWVKKLIELGLLPKTYLVGVRGGNAIQKMIDTFSDKELKAGANK